MVRTQTQTQTNSWTCGASVFSRKSTESRGRFTDLKPHLHTTDASVKPRKTKVSFPPQDSSVWGYFQLSLPPHLDFLKRSWPEAKLCEPETQICGSGSGGVILLVLCCIGCLEGEKLWSCHSRETQNWAAGPSPVPETHGSITAGKLKCPREPPPPKKMSRP